MLSSKHYLPASATKKKGSPGNWYYEVLFSIAIRFIMTLEFKFMVLEKVVGSGMAKYS
jgi:hypothetical protein